MSSSSSLNAQQVDTTKSTDQFNWETFITKPTFYDQIRERLRLTDLNKNIDSFSLRLWTSGMFGYQLMTINRENGNWKSFKYSFTSEKNIIKQKVNQNISITILVASLSFNLLT